MKQFVVIGYRGNIPVIRRKVLARHIAEADRTFLQITDVSGIEEISTHPCRDV